MDSNREPGKIIFINGAPSSGNRRVGEARTDYEAVHGFAEYDLEVGSMQPFQTNVNTLVDAWKSRQLPSAFERMAAHNGMVS